ncbi:MAG: MFS transporter [Chloroflexi bacterium]|nr:MFS transporter [Chloroflexota bacterium]
MAGLGVYRQLLANRPLTRFLFGQFISGIGDWLYIVAIFVLIYRETGDAALVGLFGAVRVIPYVVLSIPAGVIADRFDRRLVLLVSDLWRGSMMVLLTILVLVEAPVLPIAVVAILATCGSAFWYPAFGAYLPNLVTDERQLGPANSAWASLQNLSFIIGPAVGGLLLAFGGVTVAFVLNALTFVVIAVILWSLPPSKPRARGAASPTPAPAESTQREPAAPAGTAPAAGVARRPILGLLIIQATAGFFDSGMQVLTVVLAINVLNAGEAANGYLNAAIGVGGLIGAFASGVLVLRRNLGTPLILGAIVFGIGVVVLGVVPILAVAIVALIVAYSGAILLDVVMTTIFQRVVPDEQRGRWTGILGSLFTLAGAGGALALPVLVVNVGAAPTLSAAAAALVVATFVGRILIGGAARREPSRFETTLAEVARLPLFVGVPASRLEAALARIREVAVTAGEVVIRQGDAADRFYMIESGAFVVTRASGPDAEPTVLRELGPNEVFGELGLLQGSPRTATVTARTDGVLLALEGRDFLKLAGAGGPLRGRLLGLYTGGSSDTNA